MRTKAVSPSRTTRTGKSLLPSFVYWPERLAAGVWEVATEGLSRLSFSRAGFLGLLSVGLGGYLIHHRLTHPMAPADFVVLAGAIAVAMLRARRRMSELDTEEQS